MTNNFQLIEDNLKKILDDEIKNLKVSLQEKVNKKTKGMAQTIGTRYGALWEKMVKEVLSHSNIVTVGEKILYKDFVKKWTKDYVSKLDDKCCKENCTEILKSFLNVNT